MSWRGACVRRGFGETTCQDWSLTWLAVSSIRGWVKVITRLKVSFPYDVVVKSTRLIQCINRAELPWLVAGEVVSERLQFCLLASSGSKRNIRPEMILRFRWFLRGRAYIDLTHLSFYSVKRLLALNVTQYLWDRQVSFLVEKLIYLRDWNVRSLLLNLDDKLFFKIHNLTFDLGKLLSCLTLLC